MERTIADDVFCFVRNVFTENLERNVPKSWKIYSQKEYLLSIETIIDEWSQLYISKTAAAFWNVLRTFI